MKKGASHVDWVFSIGLFIVYLIILFVLIKPGIKPIHTSENLIYIIENNFKDTNDFSEGAYWVVKKTPILIYNCTRTGLQPGINPKLKVTLDGFWEFNDTSKQITREYITLPSCMSGSNVCDKLWLTYYPTKFPLNKYSLNLELTNCYADFGATETVTGISESRFLDLMKKDLKSNWSYPLSKDFKIYLLHREDLNYNLQSVDPSYSTGIQDEGSNVFVKIWRDFSLDKNYILKPIVVHLEVW